MSRPKRNIQYTNKKHPDRGIFSTVLAVLSFGTIVTAILVSYANKGENMGSAGAAVFLAMLFSAIGIVLGFMDRKKEDVLMLFPNMGIAWNIINLLLISAILYAGV